MDLQNFRDDEQWLGSLVDGHLTILNEAMEVLELGGRHLGIHGIQSELYEDNEEDSNLMIFG